MPRKLEDLTGRMFGKLEVISYDGLKPVGKVKQSFWACRCSCGTKCSISNNNLKRENSQSCGCLKNEKIKKRKVDLIGHKFGMLKVIAFSHMSNGNAIWLCDCDCGENGKEVTMPALKSGQKSCGCKQGWWRADKPGLWKNKAEYNKWLRSNPIKKIRHSVSCSIRSMLKKSGSYKRKHSIRNYLPYTIEELKLHLESLWEPWMNWSNYGGMSNDSEKTWHIDHVVPHSCFHYTCMSESAFKECWDLSNLQPLEKLANMSKGNRFDDNHITKILPTALDRAVSA